VNLGLKSAMRHVNLKLWHSLGQSIMHYTMESMHGMEIQVIQVLDDVATQVLTQTQSTHALGILHGAFWYYAGVASNPWDRWYTCAHCDHAFGHGLLIRYHAQGYTSCSTFPSNISDENSFMQAYRAMLERPEQLRDYSLFNNVLYNNKIPEGLFHGLAEHWNPDAMLSRGFLYPCLS